MPKTSPTETTCSAARWVFLMVLLWVLAVGGCGRAKSGARPRQPISIFFTCDTRGHIEPCGCASGMAGGISRRQTYLAEHATTDYLLLDAGDVTAGPREWEVLEFEYILKGYAAMGYHAVNVGHRELSLGLEGLRKIKQQYDRLVCANVLDADGSLVFDPYRIVELSGKFRCAIAGVVDDRVDPDRLGAGLRLVPPTDALSKVIEELRAKSDYIILLAFADEQAMRALAQRFFEVDLIIGGKVPQARANPIRENQSAIVFNTDKGKAVGCLEADLQPDGSWQYAGHFRELAESMDRDPQIAALVDQYKQELKKRDFRPVKDDEEGLSSIAAAAGKGADRFIGPAACEECHRAAYATWAKSRHAHAYATLEKKDQHYNPRCLECHTVGYMKTDGYINQRLTPTLKDVSCEACHGRGDLHVKAHSQEQTTAPKPAGMQTARCEACHDKDNSPHFEQGRYWEMIAHGTE